MSITEIIKEKALSLGINLVGIAPSGQVSKEHKSRLREWLDAEYMGQMSYMSRNFSKRINPSELLEQAKSVIVVGLNYKPAEQVDTLKTDNPTGTVARYARYEDYHVFIKDLLRKLTRFINDEIDQTVRFKICVDSVPLAERVLAQRAGLGFIGRNHMLINPDIGPEIFLGEIITTLKLDIDDPAEGSCKACDKCIKACPTGALQADGTFDAQKCISYLTIESKGQIESNYEKKISDRFFGCDECVLACPYQQMDKVVSNSQMKYFPQRSRVDLKEVLAMDEEKFIKIYSDTPLERTGLETLKRNAMICLKNLNKAK